MMEVGGEKKFEDMEDKKERQFENVDDETISKNDNHTESIESIEDNSEDNKLEVFSRMEYLEKELLLQMEWNKEISLLAEGCRRRDEQLLLGSESSIMETTVGVPGIIKSHISDFFNSISLPGVRYIGETNMFEKFLWSVVLMLSFLISYTYIAESYHRWRESPVLISFNDTMLHVSYIPVPAVTICPSRRLDPEIQIDTKVNYCLNENNCTDDQWNEIYAANLLCTFKLPTSREFHFYNGTLHTYFDQVTAKSTDAIKHYRFNKGPLLNDSNKDFQTVFVDGEVCFTFNMVPAKEMFNKNVIPPILDTTEGLHAKTGWSPDNMFSSTNQTTVPRHVSRSTRHSGLQFSVFTENFSPSNLCPTSNFSSYKIGVHHPAQLPSSDDFKFYRPMPGVATYIRVRPQLTTAAEELLDYAPSRRKCVFTHEKSLALFKIYTRENCNVECFVNCTMKICGCIPFSLPRFNESIRICTQQFRPVWRVDRNVFPCSAFIVQDLFEEVFDWKHIASTLRGTVGEELQEILRPYKYMYPGPLGGNLTLDEAALTRTNPNCSCHCPHTCTSLEYTADFSDAPRLDVPKDTMEFSVSFGEDYYPTIVRKELIGPKDFVAQVGGVLGVFMGFSFMALVELLHFLTLRLWNTLRNMPDQITVEHEKKVN